MSKITSSSSPKVPLILIVDDDRSMRALLNLALEEEGYRVAEAKNGEECLAEYSRLHPDMVLLDAVMPDMDGFSCCQKLRHLSDSDRIPILMITVLDDQESVENAFAVGATDYITKPIHWAVLSQRVRRMLIANQILLKAEAASQQLQKYQDWEDLWSKILLKLSQSENIWAILPSILEEIRSFFAVERIIYYQPDNQDLVESLASGYPSGKEISWETLCLQTEYANHYQQSTIVAIDELTQAELPSAILEQLSKLKVQALLIAPVIVQNQLQGLLCLHSCQISHHWHSSEIERLNNLAKLLAIAIDIRSC
jgi:CheY-like chemotaxis protein